MANHFASIRPLVAAALVLTVSSCGYDLPTAAIDRRDGAPRVGSMSAVADGERWNAVVVTAQRLDDYLILEGTAWVGDETTLAIRLTIRAVAGALPQIIDASGSIAANVVYDPTYQPRQSWAAFGTQGSGTFLISSLSATGATGTFSFTAKALTADAAPRDYRVTEGIFNVTF